LPSLSLLAAGRWEVRTPVTEQFAICGVLKARLDARLDAHALDGPWSDSMRKEDSAIGTATLDFSLPDRSASTNALLPQYNPLTESLLEF
jgi:hypothetical protein